MIAVGSNEDVAKYSGIHVNRVRAMTYILQGICVAIAVVVYVPRLGAATTTTGMLWELQAITAVVIGGTALRGGVGRIWGTICGAFMLEIVGNIMVLSNIVSEYLIGAVTGHDHHRRHARPAHAAEEEGVMSDSDTQARQRRSLRDRTGERGRPPSPQSGPERKHWERDKCVNS